MKKEHEYGSILAPYIKGLVEEKRASGFVYENEAYMLRRFDDFCIGYGLSATELPYELVAEWTLKRPDESLSSMFSRVSPVRQLALYMCAFGLPVYIPSHYAGFRETHAPYILNSDEITALFRVIDNQQPSPWHIHRFVEAEKIVFRMFYCCGLRLSEALNLRREDVNLERGILTILQSKGPKDRLVYMADDLMALCCDYYDYIHKEYPYSQWFFPGRNPEEPFNPTTFGINFKKYWKQTPYAKRMNKYPTIHSFRHTFVVDKMNEWMLSGINLKAMLPYLNKYLGHSTINDTLYYYHLVDKAFKVVRQKDSRSQNLMPEAIPYEE